jgi:hypothetical protein
MGSLPALERNDGAKGDSFEVNIIIKSLIRYL